MYGFHVERLEVFRRVNGQDGGAIFSISGAKGQVWRQARVGIASPGFNDQVLILTHHPVTSSPILPTVSRTCVYCFARKYGTYTIRN